ncbi:MAG: hypothetical protein QFB87_05010 [Patescibacteria group bacterium]|nr:hypothetical protein [Patescibacteria group bacterium]
MKQISPEQLPGLPQTEAQAEVSLAVKCIGTIALSTALVGGVTVSQAEAPHVVSYTARAEPVQPEPGELNRYAMAIAHAQATERLQKQLAARATTTTPLGVYGVALTRAGGNTIKADAILLRQFLPPLTPNINRLVKRQLRMKQPTKAEEVQTTTAYNAWRANLTEVALRRLPAPQQALNSMYQTLSSRDRQAARQRILDVFTAQYQQGVQEAVDPVTGQACNCGPAIDKYTDGHAEAWCEDFASWVYKEAALPLSGGKQYGRPDWQLPRVHTNKNSPQLISGQAWFQQNGTYTAAGKHLPEPGDFAFLKYPNAAGLLDDDHADWHVMLVLKTLNQRRLLLGGGNTENKVTTKVVATDSPNLVGFGSPFKT